jgi:hypothetical protein
MKYYRNVKVDHDPTMNQKTPDEYDEEFPIVVGGMDLPMPMDVPGVEADGFDVDEVEDLEDFEEELELDADEEAAFESESLGDEPGEEDDF